VLGVFSLIHASRVIRELFHPNFGTSVRRPVHAQIEALSRCVHATTVIVRGGRYLNKVRLEISRQAEGETARRSDGIAGEQAAKIDDVQDVVQILAVGLEAHLHAVGFVQVGAGRSVGLECGVDAAAGEVDAIEDLLAVLRSTVSGSPSKSKGRPVSYCTPKAVQTRGVTW
jgi:hypothetical protein